MIKTFDAVLDPKRSDFKYPFKELAGVGVVCKLAQGVVKTIKLDTPYIECYLDICWVWTSAAHWVFLCMEAICAAAFYGYIPTQQTLLMEARYVTDMRI